MLDILKVFDSWNGVLSFCNCLQQAESGYGSENNLRRHGSLMSLTSACSLSTTSTSSFKVSTSTFA